MTASDAKTVVYHGLPKGAHGLRLKDPQRGLETILRFVKSCLLAEAPLGWRVDVIKKRNDGEIARGVDALAEVLGNPHRRRHDGGAAQWNVAEERAPDVVRVLGALGPEFTGRDASVTANLRVSASGVMLDSATGLGYAGLSQEDFPGGVDVEPGRTLGRSAIQGNVGSSGSSLYLWCCLPPDERLGAASEHLQAQVPVKLSEKQWRLWSASPSGAGYFSRKISSPLG